MSLILLGFLEAPRSGGAWEYMGVSDARTKSGPYVLLVDDEPIVLQSLQLILGHAGYTCAACSNGNTAIQALESGMSLQLAIVDLLLPDLSGEHVLTRAKELRPDLPLIAMSGFGARLSKSRESLPLDGFLTKPFVREELLELVQQVLGTTAKEGG